MGVKAGAVAVNQFVFRGNSRHRIGPKSASSANASMETPRFFSCQRGLKPPTLSQGDPPGGAKKPPSTSQQIPQNELPTQSPALGTLLVAPASPAVEWLGSHSAGRSRVGRGRPRGDRCTGMYGDVRGCTGMYGDALGRSRPLVLQQP